MTRLITALAQAQTPGASGDGGCQGVCVGFSECCPTSRVADRTVARHAACCSLHSGATSDQPSAWQDGLHDPAEKALIGSYGQSRELCCRWQPPAAQWCLCRTAGCRAIQACLALHLEGTTLRAMLQAAVQQSLRETAGCWSRWPRWWQATAAPSCWPACPLTLGSIWTASTPCASPAGLRASR